MEHQTLKLEKRIWTAIASVALVLVFSPWLQAYGGQIETALDRTLGWAARVIGGAATLGGIIFVGIKMAAHDEEALKKGIWVIIGGLVVFMAKNIVDLIQSFTQ